MKFIKALSVATLLIISSVSFSGCAHINSYFSNIVANKSESAIRNSQEYQQYYNYLESGVLNSDGVYDINQITEQIADETDNHNGLFPVSFASNAWLICTYSINNTLLPIGTDVCYLAPGDSVCVSNIDLNNPLSNLYSFSKFRVWSYDSDGMRSSEPYTECSSLEGVIFTIPSDYSGSGFSVEPVGLYADRRITVEAYYLNSNKVQPMEGKWSISSPSDKSFSESVDISPITSYTIKYDYSTYADSYYFVDSVPKCWFNNENDHTVIFKEASSNDENSHYTVEMHKYIEFEITDQNKTMLSGILPNSSSNNKAIKSILVNGEGNINLKKLKVDDKITICVGKDYKITGNGIKIDYPVPLTDGFEYTITVPDVMNPIKLEVTSRNSNSMGTYEGHRIINASLILLRSDGSEVQIGDELPGDSETVTVIIEPFGGYYISGKNVTNGSYKETMKFSKFIDNIDSIIDSHPIAKYIIFTLKLDDTIGTYVFTLDGEKMNHKTICAKAGQKLKLSFTANEQYQISTDGWLAGIVQNISNTKTISKTIDITQDLHEKTVSIADFNIVVERIG